MAQHARCKPAVYSIGHVDDGCLLHRGKGMAIGKQR